MSAQIYIPASLREAAQHLRVGLQSPRARLSKPDLVRAWSAVAYLFPGLHPDGFDDPKNSIANHLDAVAACASF
jgi:hypothetical protein